MHTGIDYWPSDPNYQSHYVCAHLCVYVYVYWCECVSAYVWLWLQINPYLNIDTYIHICTHLCLWSHDMLWMRFQAYPHRWKSKVKFNHNLSKSTDTFGKGACKVLTDHRSSMLWSFSKEDTYVEKQVFQLRR